MKKITLFLSLFLVPMLFCAFALSVFAETPSRMIDGKVQFPKASVNGEVCWTDEEVAEAEAKYSAQGGTTTVVTVAVVPTDEEKELAKEGKFENLSDFKSSTSKDGIFQRMKDAYVEYLLAQDLGDTKRIQETEAKYLKLKDLYGKVKKSK